MTTYPEINELLSYFSKNIKHILGKNLVGLYLSGSLSYGDFNPNRSDIDFMVITQTPLSQKEIAQLKQLHEELKAHFPKWHDRVECSYTPIEMLTNILPPKSPRPYFNDIFYDEVPYGNEWIINNYLLYHHAISLIGSDFKTLCKPIDMSDVQAACIRDLLEEWEPKIKNSESLKNSHYQSYVILNFCRILYTVFCGIASTKKISAAWVKNQFGQWRNLIEAAEHWKYGDEMPLIMETVKFIEFVIAKVNQNSAASN